MNNSELQNKISAILEPELQAQNWFLVDSKINTGKVQVFIDSEKGFTIENCVRVSRMLENELDKQFNFSELYSLEVSSPGMDEPLKIFRQYKKYTGRKVIVVLHDGTRKEGRMVEVDEEKIVLEESKIEKHKEVVLGKIEILFNQIKSTTLVVTF